MLREIAEQVQRSVAMNRTAYYGEDRDGPTFFKESFRSHFPEIVPLIDQWDESKGASEKQKNQIATKLRAELEAAGMADLPWQDMFFAPGLVEFAYQRALTEGVVPPEFDWHQLSGGFYWGLPNSFNLIFGAESPEQDVVRQAKFEQFVAALLTWPELEEIRPLFLRQQEMARKLDESLQLVKVRQRIFGSCNLCRAPSGS